MQINNRKILVVGLARTGVALCRFLAEQGAQVTVTDQAPPDSLAEPRRDIQGLGVVEDLGVPQPRWQGFDAIVLSPGVPPELPWLNAARAAGLPVVGELEVAAPFIRRPLLAVSGTNGKTTTTTLLGELLTASGKKTLVGGNIGTPVVSLLAGQEAADLLVLEVSSFQLDTAFTFHPQAAALLNLTPDHLDRYADYDAYLASKASLFRCQEPGDLQVLNADDPAVAGLDRGLSRVYYFSATRPLATGAWLNHAALKVRLAGGREETFPLSLSGCKGGTIWKTSWRPCSWPWTPGPTPRPAVTSWPGSAACPTAWNGWPTSRGCPSTTTPRAPTSAQWPPPWRTSTGR